MAVLLIFVALFPIAVPPGDESVSLSPIGKRLAPAFEKASAEAVGKKVLVVVTEDSRGTPDEWRIAAWVRDEIVQGLRGVGVRARVSSKVEKLINERERDPQRRNQPIRLEELRELSGFEMLLSGSYLRRGRSRVLQLQLYDNDKKRVVWKKGVALRESDVQINQYVPELNRKTLAFATARQGKRVGDGECWTLAARALEDAGARRKGSFGFGRKLGVRDSILPGDVIQFFKVKLGPHSMPQHTAIVYEVLGSEKLTMIHQNSDGEKFVSLLTIDLDQVKTGSIDFYRPRS